MKKKKSVRPVAVRVANGTAKVGAILFVVSCSGQDGLELNPEDRVEHIPAAFAATRVADASVDITADTPSADQAIEPATTAEPPMPENPVHAAFCFKRVGQVVPSSNLGAPLPYPHEVIDDGDSQVLVVHLPHKKEGGVGVQVTQLNEQLEPVGEPREYTVETRGRIGTLDIDLDATGGTWNIGSDAEHILVLGDNTLEGKVTRQFIAGAIREVIQGIFTAVEAGTYRIAFEGTEELYSYLDAPPEAHEEAFEVSLKAGQVLALWIPVGPSTNAVTVQVTPVEPACAPPPPPEE